MFPAEKYILVYIYIYIFIYLCIKPKPGLEIVLIKKFVFPGGTVISHVNGIFLTCAALDTIIQIVPKFEIRPRQRSIFEFC